ncbi:GSCFA domain-containing protein [Apibacter sp.]|uniref:GSCFA domain-containing protein n=1 Tax=Apibacter sp. TaxID=2023709 RepID=UPI0025FCC2A3|nr:GSCFA domain-containing protein [Apibacter sp.]MCT6869314.1 GSCFA domain-containing protein [Apibacter sp.]
MIFRTELPYNPNNSIKIDYKSKIFTIGSCFATEISNKLSEYKFSVMHNPFGVIFHPLAIENAIMRIFSQEEYQASELFKYEELYLSWDHHSSFSDISKEKVLNTINQNIHQANSFLQETDMVIITLGTSFVYKLTQFDIIVANCHKIPNSNFSKILLAEHQIKTSLKNIIEMLTEMGKKEMKIFFTLSPVRHIKDGIIENNKSKSKLLCAIHSVVESYDNCEYFPSYEFMMDDLRDYRFYKEDMIHPNDLAIKYIWEKFKTAHISSKDYTTMQMVKKVNTSLQHKIQNKHTIAYKKFLYSILKHIKDLEPFLPPMAFKEEFQELRNRMNESY